MGGWVSSLLPHGRVGVVLRRAGGLNGHPPSLSLSGGLSGSFDSTLPAECSMLELTQTAGAGVLPVGAVRPCGVCGGRIRQMVDGSSCSVICKRCLIDIFPFNHIVNNREFREVITSFSPTKGHLEKAKKLRFNPLDDNLKHTLAGYDKTLSDCRYFELGQFLKFKQQFLSKNSVRLSLLCLNVNGLPKKRDELSAFMETLKFKFDVIGLTETHLNEVSEKYATLEDYTLVSNSRKKKSWGGVAIYLRTDVTFKRRTDIDIFEEGVLESIFVEIISGGSSHFVGVVYRPPGSDLARFMDRMGVILSKFSGKRLNLMGDFNLDLIKSSQHLATGEFLAILNNVGLHHLISLPSRITPKSATLIDNIFSTDIGFDVSSGLILTSISDHFPVFSFFGGARAANQGGPQYTLKRVIGDKGKERFRLWVEEWGKSFAPQVNSVAEDAARFRNELRDEYNKCFPLKKVKVCKINEIKPWLNDVGLLDMIRKRDRLYTRNLKRPGGLSHADLALLRSLTAGVNKQRKDLKRSYFARRLEDAGKDSGKAWRVLHSFIGKQSKGSASCRTFDSDGVPITGDQAIADSFCDFFTNIGSGLASKVGTPTSGSFRDYLGAAARGSVFMFPTSAGEIESLCLDLDPSKGPGHDEFSPLVVRHASSEISVPLSRLINVCLEAGYFPDFMKVAKVTPVFKADDPTQFGNYRPISVLSVFSKIFERVIQGRLLSFLNKGGQLLANQYGFRRGHSTDMAVMDMVENIRKAWEKGESCLGIFVDFKKAFDTVNHHILLAKMEHFGIRGAPLELIRSYLSNRRQYVVFNGAESAQEQVSLGVPQGSILGPLLFLLYINDLSRASSFFKCILFADDTNLFASGKSQGELYRKVKGELLKLSAWFAHNRLTVNYAKTEYIDFSKPASTSADRIALKMDGNLIRKVNESKFLGVQIDKDISWRGHIGKVLTKVRQTMGIIGRARGFMTGPQLLLLYNTMVLPHLQYCLLNWGNFKGDCNTGLRGRLLSLQKSLVRIITASRNPISHADPLFAKLAVLKIDDLFAQRVRVFSFKLDRNLLPCGVSSIFDKASHTHGTRGASSNLFVGRSDDRSMRSIAPKCWNSLVPGLKKSPSISSFKDSSKRGLLAPYSLFSCDLLGCPSCVGVAPP